MLNLHLPQVIIWRIESRSEITRSVLTVQLKPVYFTPLTRSWYFKQLNIIISIQSLQILPEIGPGPARRKKIMFFDLSIPPDKLQDSLNI